MATNYPNGYDSLTNPTGTDALSSPAHASQHADANDAIEAIQATLGLNPEGAYANVDARLDALVTDAAAAASSYADASLASAGSALASAGSAAAAAGTAYSYQQGAETNANQAAVSAGSAYTSMLAAAASESAAAISAGAAATSAASIEAYADLPVEFRQFAADGSVLSNLPARVHPAEQLLKQAVWWIDAAHSSASGQTIKNLGWGGSALDAQCGSTGSADSNDPKYLAWEGENYVYCPGVAGNYLSVPDEAALDITGDIEVIVDVAPDSWSSTRCLASKAQSSGQLSWALLVRSTGALRFYHTSDGSTSKIVDSTATLSLAAGTRRQVKVTLDVDNGASGHDVRFYTSSDGGATWTQLGATVTTAGTTSIYSSTSQFAFGFADYAPEVFSGAIHRAIVKDGIDGTPVLDVDCSQITSGADTSFTALTGQTVTINRSTSGRKTVGVVHPRWLFGTDDYMEVADNDLLDFGASDSFTVVAVVRQWANSVASGRWLDKRGGSGAGWLLLPYSTALYTYPYLTDGTNAADGSGSSIVYRTFTYASLNVIAQTVDRLSNTLKHSVNGDIGAGLSISSVGSVANSAALRVGTISAGSAYQDFELTAAAVFRRALTQAEIQTLSDYYSGRA